MSSTTAPPITTRTSPMAGVFTPPSSCSSHWTYEDQAANSVTGGLLLQNANAGQGDQPCLPTGFGGWGRAPSFIQVFSPGTCPYGYTTANNAYGGQTTTAVCCMSNFGYTNFISSVNAGGITAQYYGCTSIFTKSGATTVVAADDSDGPSTVVSGQITMWAQPITVAFQQNDLSLFTTSVPSTSSTSSTSTSSSTTSTSSASTTSATTSPSSSSPTTSPTQTQTPNPGPSTGAIAGIVVGAVALLALIIGASLYFRKRRASSKHSNVVEMHNAQEGYSETAKLDHRPQDASWDRSYHKDPAEFRDAEPIELPNYRTSRRHELP